MVKRKKNPNQRNTYFPNYTLAQIEAFPSAWHGGVEFSAKVQEIIRDLSAMLDRTRREVEPLFTSEEWSYLRDMLNSTVLSPDLSYRVILSAQVEEADRYEGLGEKWGVDSQLLAGELRDLPEFQAYTVAKMVDEYWSQKEE